MAHVTERKLNAGRRERAGIGAEPVLAFQLEILQDSNFKRHSRNDPLRLQRGEEEFWQAFLKGSQPISKRISQR